MKPLFATAAVSLLAATAAHAQVLGPGPGAGQTAGQPAGVSSSGAGVFGGQVGTPLGSPQTAPGVNIGTDVDKAPPEIMADPARGAVNNPIQNTTPLDARAQARGAVDDSRTLSPGQVSSDASARVDDSQLAAGLAIRGNNGATYGRITRVMRDKAGQVTGVVVQGADGVSRSMPSQGLTVTGGAAVTTRSQADFNGLPRAR